MNLVLFILVNALTNGTLFYFFTHHNIHLKKKKTYNQYFKESSQKGEREVGKKTKQVIPLYNQVC